MKTKPERIEMEEKPENRFLKRYEQLCRETGFQLVAEPRWGQSKDQGDYRLVVIMSIVPIPKEA